MQNQSKNKDILNRAEFEKWLGERMEKNCTFRAIKDFVEEIYYNDGTSIDGTVNVAWVCNETQERFDFIWGYATN